MRGRKIRSWPPVGPKDRPTGPEISGPAHGPAYHFRDRPVTRGLEGNEGERKSAKLAENRTEAVVAALGLKVYVQRKTMD